MTWIKENWYRLIIITMLVLAIMDLPYGYYQLLRWIVSIASFYLAYILYLQASKFWIVLFATLGIIFNPLIPFYLEKETWMVIDLIAALIYLISIFKTKSSYERKN